MKRHIPDERVPQMNKTFGMSWSGLMYKLAIENVSDNRHVGHRDRCIWNYGPADE